MTKMRPMRSTPNGNAGFGGNLKGFGGVRRKRLISMEICRSDSTWMEFQVVDFNRDFWLGLKIDGISSSQFHGKFLVLVEFGLQLMNSGGNCWFKLKSDGA